MDWNKIEIFCALYLFSFVLYLPNLCKNVWFVHELLLNSWHCTRNEMFEICFKWYFEKLHHLKMFQMALNSCHLDILTDLNLTNFNGNSLVQHSSCPSRATKAIDCINLHANLYSNLTGKALVRKGGETHFFFFLSGTIFNLLLLALKHDIQYGWYSSTNLCAVSWIMIVIITTRFIMLNLVNFFAMFCQNLLKRSLDYE